MTLPIRLRRIIEQARTPQLSTDLRVHGAFRALTQEIEQEILRIAQESIQNTKRHAGAQHLNVELDYEEKALTMMVRDDGRGFVTQTTIGKETPESGSPKGHYGLTGIRERAGIIRGQVEIISSPGEGTTVKLSVPIAGSALRNLQ